MQLISHIIDLDGCLLVDIDYPVEVGDNDYPVVVGDNDYPVEVGDN